MSTDRSPSSGRPVTGSASSPAARGSRRRDPGVVGRAILGRDARTRTHDARVTLVVGPETLLAERAIAAVVVAARAADDEADVSEVAGGDLTAAALAEHVSPSLFATRRVLVVRGVEDVADPAARALVAYAAHPVDDVHLVLVHPGGPKGRRLLDDLRDTRPGWSSATGSRVRTTRLTSFARRSRPRVGGSTSAARRLVEAVGGDLRGLASAAGQLAADAEGGVGVDTAVVATYFEGRAEVKGWVVADRAVEGRTADALEQLRWALETGTDPVLVTAALATAVRSLARLAGPRVGSATPISRATSASAVEGPRPARATARVDPLGPGPRDPRRRRRRPAGQGGGNDATLALTTVVVEIGAAQAAA